MLGTALAAAASIAAVPGCGGTGAGSDNRIRAAFPTGGSGESLDPHISSLFVDQARAKALFDTLVGYDSEMRSVPRLAVSWEPDPTGTRWLIRLRRARFHDGRPVTAKDVLYSYRRIAEAATASPARPYFTEVDFTASRARSATELELVLRAPNFEFASAWGAPGAEIIPAGTTKFRAPVGSGPFQLASFQPGQSTVVKKFDGYWAGAPNPAEVEFVSINEEAARVSALLSGQVHYANDVSANSASQLHREQRTGVLAAKHGTMQAVAFKIDRRPFSDPRVLRAVLLGVDRQQLLDVALSGQGQLGNDLFGKGLKYYPDALPQRRRDVDRARSLLREAGAERLTFELNTSAVDPYFESAASLIAEQLGELGIRVSPRVGPSETYFSDIESSGVAGHTRTSSLPIATFLGQRMRGGADINNYTGYQSDGFDSLFDRALRTQDESRRAELLADAQRLIRDDSGMLVWGFSNWNVGISSELRGMRAAPPNSLHWARFDHASLG
ncbi:MAG: ABC transporter substrate-binding protein [Pseudonocardiaceae bacterium]|nr:ABC transporter substrate-binding protein [Pseudonocardiaceae bacterium]